MAECAEEALQVAAEADQLSFYGLSYWLDEVSKLLDRVDNAALAKTPSAEDEKLTEQKDDLLQAQSLLRRSMGAQLESPSLTKRERPLAEAFLKQQTSKLEKGLAAASGTAAPKAQRALEKLKFIQLEIAQKPAAKETREVQELQASIAAADAEWKLVSPIHDKWEAGRHAFKTNADLQVFSRRYKEALKIRESGSEKLEKALRCNREGKALAVPVQDNTPKPGWFSASAPKKAAAPRSSVRRVAQPNAWGSVMNFAQRLRSEAGAQVRREVAEGEAQENDDSDDAEDDTNDAAPPAQVVRPKPKAAPPLPKAAPLLVDDDGFKAAKPGGARPPPPRAPQRPVEDSDEDDAAMEASRSSKAPPSYNASAKKKGKAGKKKKGGGREEDDDDDDVPEPRAGQSARLAKPTAAAWTASVEASISGSVLQELFRSESWSSPGDDVDVDERFKELKERLPWVSPLGMRLPLEWKEFASLEVDGGPKRTSRRGEPEWVGRVQKNVATLLGHYITIVFGITALHALSNFGLMLGAVVLQAGLILAPADAFHLLKTPARITLLQIAHLLLWLLFLRSLWQMHFFAKCFVVICTVGHGYVIVPMDEE